MSTETQEHEQGIPFDNGTMWGNGQDSIMSMRWENKELMAQLWKNLAYMEVHYIGGKAVLKSAGKDAHPPMNAAGARAIINIIQSVVNTVGSLSKIHQDQAMILLRHIKTLTRRLVAVNGKRYGCERRVDKHMVLQIVENICFLQLMRPVAGHESNHSRINLVEKREEGTYTSSSNKKSWNPFSKGSEQ